ncbi:MAG: PepSY-associated TM helix domain-containing protein [Limnobacter sp.]
MKAWVWIHRWTSLICTVFMIVLSLTGFPLIFEHELDEWLGETIHVPDLPGVTQRANLDNVLATAVSHYPDKGGMFMSQDQDDDRVWYVTLAPAPDSESGIKQVAVDARSGDALGQLRLEGGVMNVIESIHVDLLMGLPGMLFLGGMGVLLVLSLVSGVVVYAPFARKPGFAAVRPSRGSRVRWLDAHNALGIVTLVWFFVVGGTGVINAVADLLVKQWQRTALAELVQPYAGHPISPVEGTLNRAVEAARKAQPDKRVLFIAFPGTSFASPHHYGVYMRGTTPLTARLSTPVLVDVRSGAVAAVMEMPWTLKLLQISRPLHFGDYGGMPLKWIWAVLNLMSLVVLCTGLVLWFKRGARHAQ